MPRLHDAYNDMLEGTIFRMKLNDDQNDQKDDNAGSSALKSFAKKKPTAPKMAIGSQTPDFAMTYKFPGNKSLTVNATTSINERQIPVCQVCHHLNPDFVQCNKYSKFSGSWAMREFKEAGKLRSCSFDISKGKDLVDRAAKGCRYCNLLCTALTKMLPDWKSKDSVIDVQLAWGLSIILEFQYGTRGKSTPTGGFNPLTWATPDLELETRSPTHFVIDVSEVGMEKQILEIYKPGNSPVGQEKCFPNLCHLGLAPERLENTESVDSYNEMNTVIQQCRSGIG